MLKHSPARSAGARLLSDAAWAAVGRSLNLSGRELEIARGVFDDKVEFAIAADLQISPRTVHSHVERLHHKLAITNRAQLVLRIMREFLALTASAKNGLPPVCATRAAGGCPLRL
jgi:DNA-binding NarL/FixJ family response regulator